MKILCKSKTLLAIAGFIALQGPMVSAGPDIDPIPIPIDPVIILPPFLLQFDAKTFHGSECEPVFPQQANDFRYFFNRIQHVAGGGARFVTCPIVRDNTVNTNGTFGTEIYVNNVPNQSVTCTLYSFNSHGAVIASDTESTALTGRRTLRPDVNLSKNMGYYGLYCRLPLGTSLYSYKVKEHWSGANRRTDWSN